MTTRADDSALLTALRRLQANPSAGFAERVLARVGRTEPAEVDEVDEFVVADGPTGELFVAFNRTGICHVLAAELVDGDPDLFSTRHRQRFGRAVRPALKAPDGLAAALRSGRSTTLAFDLRGLSDFERAVLAKAADIPRGEVRPYGWVAREIGRPKAVRAVGSALGRNPVPVLIPCHRVVRADGQIGQYAFGSPMKRALLGSEDLDVGATEAQASRGLRYVGSDTTKIFCFPSCHHAKRITAPHQVRFRHAGQAADAGYRPCSDCRPANALSA